METGKNSRMRMVIALALYFTAVIIISGIIYYNLELDPSEHTSKASVNTELQYKGKTVNGSYMIEIVNQDPSNDFLGDVKISVYGNTSNKAIYTNKLLSHIKKSYQNNLSDEEIIYDDSDNDDIVSTGDIIYIWIDPSMPGSYRVELNYVSDQPLVEGTFIAY